MHLEMKIQLNIVAVSFTCMHKHFRESLYGIYTDCIVCRGSSCILNEYCKGILRIFPYAAHVILGRD